MYCIPNITYCVLFSTHNIYVTAYCVYFLFQSVEKDGKSPVAFMGSRSCMFQVPWKNRRKKKSAWVISACFAEMIGGTRP